MMRCIYYSDDYANSWTEITAGLGVMTFYNFNILNGDMGGTQDNEQCSRFWKIFHSQDSQWMYSLLHLA